MPDYFSEYVLTVSEALSKTAAVVSDGTVLDVETGIERWVDAAKDVRDRRGVFYFIGNGASATMAEHMSHDCFQNADMLTQTCAETSHITAIANDLSYSDVFSYRIGKSASEKDMLIAISSSGNSPNVIKAIETAGKLGLYIVTVTGKSADNKARKLGNLNFYIPLDTYGLVESAHAVLLHCWLDRFLDKYMGGRH